MTDFKEGLLWGLGIGTGIGAAGVLAAIGLAVTRYLDKAAKGGM